MQSLDQITLEVDSTATETAWVRRLTGRRYVLADTPAITGFGDAQLHAGDIIEVEPAENGCFRITDVERSDVKHHDFAVPREFIESPEFGRFCDEVAAAGGAWESTMGGLLYVHLPEGSDFDAEAALMRHIALAEASQKEA